MVQSRKSHAAAGPEALELVLWAAEKDLPEADYQPLRLVTSRGEVACRYYGVPRPAYGAIWVGGAGGGWDTPAQGLYPRLAGELRRHGIASLRLRFRDAHMLEECVLDVLAGATYLKSLGVRELALVGHSLGAAVVIQAAAEVPEARTVVALATQSFGADAADRLGPRCSLLLLHGENDEVLPPGCSEYVYDLAQEPKRLTFYTGARHVLDEVADQVHDTVRDWLIEQLTDRP